MLQLYLVVKEKGHLRFRKRSRIQGIALVGCVVVLLVLYWRVENNLARTLIGVQVSEVDQGVLIEALDPGLPALRAGLRAGDLILEVDGRAIRDLTSFDEAFIGGPPNSQVEFAVRRDESIANISVQRGIPFPWATYLACAVAAFFFLALGLLALLSPVQSLRTKLLAYLCAAVAIEMSLPEPYPGGFVSESLLAIFFAVLTGLQLGLQLHLIALIPEPHRWVKKYRGLIPGFYLAGGLVATLTVLTELVYGLDLISVPDDLYQMVGRVELAVLPLWALAQLVLLVSQVVHQGPSKARHQAGLVLVGVLPWVILVWWLFGLGIFGLTKPLWSAVGLPLTSAFFPVACFIAMFRYQLFENDLVVRRQLIYNLLTANLLLLGYLVLGMAGLLALHYYLDDPSSAMWLVSAGALLLGVSFVPLRTWVQKVVERRFFPKRSLLRHRLTGLAAEVARQRNASEMAQMLTTELPEILGAHSSTLLLADPGTGLFYTYASSLPDFEDEVEHSLFLSSEDAGVQRLHREMAPLPVSSLTPLSASLSQRIQALEAEIAIPLLRREKLSGLLFLGARKNGEPFPEEEVDLLTLLAHHVASSLENVQLFESATLEELTGLLRREAILECVRKELQRSLRYGRPMSVAMIDLDHFKEINDRFGHLTGDEILKSVAELLSKNVRSSDLLGRYGGEEFLLVMPETDLESGVAVSNKLRELVGAAESKVRQDSVRVTLSIGVSQLRSTPGEEAPTIWQVIAEADEQLYLAKNSGRDRVEPMTPSDLGAVTS
ncbi:MAG: diguanylate cyclase [Deltaproteobacteria bacterium]|nr:diguanylate cyclase [Deltaproteobacteria bacterium]